MIPVFTKEERLLFSAKNPKEYIDKSIKLKISAGRKAYVTREWLKKTGYKKSELEYQRNRHPFWKEKKISGTIERNLMRAKKHNYGDGARKHWDEKLIQKFLDSNKKSKNGKYEYRDWELAKHFKCTIATVQHMRRKYNMAVKILTKKSKVTNKNLLEFLTIGEEQLRKMKKKL
jgi:hypothetical protein